MSTQQTKVIITGDASGFVRAAQQAQGASVQLGTALGGLQGIAAKGILGNMSAMGLAGVAAGVGASLIAVAGNAIATGDELDNLAQRTGISVEELSKLRYAAQMSDLSNESLAKGLAVLSVKMVEAGDGSGMAGEKMKKLGFDVRNLDGTIKTSRQMLDELADRFATMPDGPEKTALAVEFFGKKIGTDMIPLLNSGSAGLKAMGDEAERLGRVMSTQTARAAAEFNDNLDRLKGTSESVGIALANKMLPVLNEVLGRIVDAQKTGAAFTPEKFFGGDPAQIPKRIAEINKSIDEMRKKQAAGEWRLLGSWEDDIKKAEKERAYFEAQLKRQSGDGVQSAEELAKKRLSIESQYHAKYIQLVELRAVAAGKISADILLDDTKRTDEQIKNAEKLRDALRSAWQSSLDEAKKAGDEAVKLLQKAADIRQTGADKAAAKRRSGKSPEQQQAEIEREFEAAQRSAEINAASASYAAMFGRTEAAAKYAEQAARDAERASRFAEQIDDPETGARAIERNAETQAGLVEGQARAKQQEQQAAEERAAAQAKMIVDLDKQITDLQTRAAAIKVEADITAAQSAINTLKAELDNLKDKTVTVTVNQVGGSAPAEGSGATGSFAYGGYTGPGGKFQPAGIVHAGEFVLRQEVVRQRGALAFLERFNRVGLDALKGYATGGLVQRLAMPSLPAAPAGRGGAAAVFNFPGMGSFPVQMAPNVLGEMKAAFAREALMRGSRR